MNQEGELIETRARLARLNEVKGEKNSKSSSGIKGTLMKFKERRRKKTSSGSYDSPVMASHEEECLSPTSEESKVPKDSTQAKNKGMVLFNKKSPKCSPKHSPKNSPPSTSPVVSQVILSKLLEESEGKHGRVTVEEHLDKAKRPLNDLFVGDLSQLSLSQSGTYSDHVTTSHSSQESLKHTNGITPSTTTDFMLKEFLANEQFKNGCPDLYHSFGDTRHQANFEKVLNFLSSTGEEKPVDLSVLQDWDGWSLTNKDLM